MTKFIFLVTLVLLTACAGAPLAKRVPQTDVLRVPVADRAEAKKKIQRDYNFLKLLFEESRDPYYGTPRWGEECLKLNKFEFVEEEKMLVLRTRLLLVDGKPGHCPTAHGAKYIQEFHLYCEGEKDYWKITAPLNENPKLTHGALCP